MFRAKFATSRKNGEKIFKTNKNVKKNCKKSASLVGIKSKTFGIEI